MATKKILYVCSKREHLKVFESFEPTDGVYQIIAFPSFIKPYNIKIPCVAYNYQEDLKQIIKKQRPTVYVQCDFSDFWHKKLEKYGIKIALMGHGVWDNSPVNYNITSNDKLSYFNAIFGGNETFKEILTKHYGFPSNRVFTNCLPQFDTLYHRIKHEAKIREKLLKASKCPGAEKIITLFSHRMGSKQFAANNSDYYTTALQLAIMAKANNWLLIIKLKQKEIVSDDAELAKYFELRNNSNVMFVNPGYEVYDYFCTDVIVCAGRSTVEVEACLANKPLVIVRTQPNIVAGSNDTLNTVKDGCAYLVDDQDNLENTIYNAMRPNRLMVENQNKYVGKLGITFDGKASHRVVKILKKL